MTCLLMRAPQGRLPVQSSLQITCTLVAIKGTPSKIHPVARKLRLTQTASQKQASPYQVTVVLSLVSDLYPAAEQILTERILTCNVTQILVEDQPYKSTRYSTYLLLTTLCTRHIHWASCSPDLASTGWALQRSHPAVKSQHLCTLSKIASSNISSVQTQALASQNKDMFANCHVYFIEHRNTHGAGGYFLWLPWCRRLSPHPVWQDTKLTGMIDRINFWVWQSHIDKICTGNT